LLSYLIPDVVCATLHNCEYSYKPSNTYMDASESVFVITGATHGLGRACAMELAQVSGGYVVLACRNLSDASKLANTIYKDFNVKKGRVIVLEEPLNLCEETSVRKYALLLSNWLKSNSKTIKTLINNAGLGQVPFSTNSRGYEMVFATNYLGHFMLTILLLPHIHGRIINVSSGTHDPDLESPLPDPGIAYPKTESEYVVQALYGQVPFAEGMKAREMRYTRTKLFLVLFTYELARRVDGSYPLYISNDVKKAVRDLPYGDSCKLPDAKSLSAVAIDPGLLLETNMFSKIFGPIIAFILWLLIPLLRMIPYFRRWIRTMKESSHHLTKLAMFPDLGVTAGYFVDGKAVPSSEFSLSLDGLTKHAVMLWDLSIQWSMLTDKEIEAAGL